ncbi:phosphate acyltransferase PlsX [Murdochiella vaginalis]|uniref:phosphate acyltransferase PlsX n=1 Tax=Murdochiella vaginalis TaxID=1852373 RepID=UPI0008FD9E48|nr:phosphate acyltransferase PlsX [Murdochiella vaginalis]
MTKLIIDALGSDAGPKMVASAIRSALSHRAFSCVVVGPSSVLSPTLKDLRQVEIVDTDVSITNDESPVFAIRRKKQSSLVLAFSRLNADGDVLLSAGSTGALLAGGYFLTKRITGMERMCLVPTIPHVNGGILLADAGATMDTTPAMLLQFAQISAAYAERALGKSQVKVGLLNVGQEAEKGDKRAVETHRLLEESDLRFVGNVEARDILFADCDVLVADGFAGNIALKSMEGTAKFALQTLKNVLYSNAKTKLGGLLIKKNLKQAFGALDYRAHGGAPLLGARKAIYKAHGNSTAETFALAIAEALDFAESGVIETIAHRFAESGNADKEESHVQIES